MSEMMRGEYEVFKILRDCCIEGLKVFGISEGLDVRRFAQANFNHGDKLVLLNFIRTTRVGWQSAKYPNTSEEYGSQKYRQDEWIEEQTYQISTIKRMLKTDSVETLSAEDMATCLISWFNGRGIEWLRERGLSNYLIDPNSIMVYNDDSDLYQRRPVFELTIIVNKAFKLEQEDLDILGVKTFPI